MATVYVAPGKSENGQPAKGKRISATIGKETVELIAVDIGNERLNAIQAAERAGVFIPRYCWHPALSVVASCRMCLVEIGDRKPDGTIAMGPKVVPACQTPVKDGTVIVAASARAKSAQEQTPE